MHCITSNYNVGNMSLSLLLAESIIPRQANVLRLIWSQQVFSLENTH